MSSQKYNQKEKSIPQTKSKRNIYQQLHESISPCLESKP